MHTGKMLSADLPRRRLLRINPHTLHFLLDGLPHVPEESPMWGMRRDAHVRVEVLVVVRLVVSVGSRVEHLVVVRQVVLGDVAVVVEKHRLGGGGLGRKVVATEEKISGGVTAHGAHVAVVLKVVILVGGGHRRRRLVLVAGTHLQPVRGQMVVVAAIHESVYHREGLLKQGHWTHDNTRNAITTATDGVHSWTERAVGHSWRAAGRRSETIVHWSRTGPLLLVPTNNEIHAEILLVHAQPIATGGGTRWHFTKLVDFLQSLQIYFKQELFGHLIGNRNKCHHFH